MTPCETNSGKSGPPEILARIVGCTVLVLSVRHLSFSFFFSWNQTLFITHIFPMNNI